MALGSGAADAPGTLDGRRLLAHELAHVVQQQQEGSWHSPSTTSEAEGLEGEAERAAARAVSGQDVGSLSRRSEPTQRRPDPAALVVEDGAGALEAGQMRKTAFLQALREETCRAVEAAIAPTGHTTEECPYLDRWFAFYSERDAAHVDRAMRRYAPETERALSAGDAIQMVAAQARRSAEHWAATGEVSGVPEDFGAVGAIGGAVAGAVGELTGLLFSARPGGAVRASAAAVAGQLGAGRPLDGAVRSPMERAFGRSFAGVRIHADRPAAALSEGLNARAFTIGRDVAFGANQFKPGTPAGDALIAHELAHVVQQAMPAGGASDSALERDANAAAAAALGGGRAATTSGGGLRLQRCKDGDSKVPKIEVSVQPVSVANDDGSSPTAIPSFASAQTIWAKCCLTLKVAAAKTVSKTALRILNEAPHPATPTTPNAEEQQLMTAAGAGGGTIFVIIPENFKDGANVSKNIRGGGTTRQLNLADATCFLVEGSDPTNVAHELGHAMGIRSHTAGTVMEGSGAYDKPNPTSVSAALCNTVKSFPYGKASSSSDCDITP